MHEELPRRSSRPCTFLFITPGCIPPRLPFSITLALLLMEMRHIGDGVRKLGLPSHSVSMCVLDQNILCIRFSCCKGVISDTVTSLSSAEDQPWLGTRQMEVDLLVLAPGCPESTRPSPDCRRRSLKLVIKNNLSSCRNIRG